MCSRIAFGHWGEEVATDYLEQKGYRILERNFHCRGGEIDLIVFAPDGQLVFVEVKTRTSADAGSGEESIHARKRSRLKRAAGWYLSERALAIPEEENYRFDALVIERSDLSRKILVKHIMNIFS